MAQPANLELVRVSKRYGATLAVDAIDLRVPADGYCCLLGPSGCGKTSTLRMIAGHEAVSEGDILIGDANVTDLPPAKRGTAMMFQSYALFPHLSCVDNVAFSLKMRGVDRAKRRAQAMEFLELVAMEPFAERVPAQLSGGQQQRVALARALITHPHVPVVILLQLADLVVIMNKGKIEQAGSPLEVFEKPATEFVARFLGGHNVVETPAGLIAVRADRVSVVAEASNAARLAAVVASVEYQGASYQVGLEAPGARDLSAVVGDAAFTKTPLAIGDRVGLAWLDADIHPLSPAP